MVKKNRDCNFISTGKPMLYVGTYHIENLPNLQHRLELN